MSYTVYCHTNTINGKKYVGITKQTMEARWKSHVYAALNPKGKNCTFLFPKAIRKYGKDAFAHEVLEVCDSLEGANAAEQKWIDQLKTTDPSLGYNMEPGGGASGPRSPEMKAKVSAALKARYASPDARAALSHPGTSGRPKGLKLSDGHKQAISERLQVHYSDPEKRQRLQDLGRNVSSETRAKLSDRMKQRYVDDPDLRLVRNAKGAKRSDEAKARMKIAALAREQAKRKSQHQD